MTWVRFLLRRLTISHQNFIILSTQLFGGEKVVVLGVCTSRNQQLSQNAKLTNYNTTHSFYTYPQRWKFASHIRVSVPRRMASFRERGTRLQISTLLYWTGIRFWAPSTSFWEGSEGYFTLGYGRVFSVSAALITVLHLANPWIFKSDCWRLLIVCTLLEAFPAFVFHINLGYFNHESGWSELAAFRVLSWTIIDALSDFRKWSNL